MNSSKDFSLKSPKKITDAKLRCYVLEFFLLFRLFIYTFIVKVEHIMSYSTELSSKSNCGLWNICSERYQFNCLARNILDKTKSHQVEFNYVESQNFVIKFRISLFLYGLKNVIGCYLIYWCGEWWLFKHLIWNSS